MPELKEDLPEDSKRDTPNLSKRSELPKPLPQPEKNQSQ